MEQNYFDFIICGGGASGLLLLKALREDSHFDQYSVLLIEKDAKNKNDRTWCFWESSSDTFDKLLTKEWSNAEFRSKEFKKQFDLAPLKYKMLRSSKFYKLIQSNYLKTKNTFHLQSEIKEVKTKKNETEVVTDKGNFQSTRVFNSLYNPEALLNQKKYPVLRQHFVGWFIKTNKPIFDPGKILFMDFDIPQEKETRFLYVLPLKTNYALVEYTLFSENLLENESYENGIKSYLESKGIYDYIIEEKEKGNIPMTCFPFDKFNSNSLLHIGTAGGWTKASTGFTFMNTIRNIKSLILFLKTNNKLKSFKIKSRFKFYDLLFLDVLARYNSEGSKLFSRMFEKNPPLRIFRFLDGKTSLSEEIKIMASFNFNQKFWFVKAFLQRLF